MRSLWSGVTGLNAHQVAMDVEGNNIANVNTNGFKYSRANFSDLLSQTSKIATAPQRTMGGKNPMQVGLGTEINSVTRMFSQGSIQTTSKTTDLAIQGEGFFVLSADQGKTYRYSRSGDFVFDANGNFVNNQGLKVQGWVRDPKTGEIDNTAPIRDIVIPPGLTTPARATTLINLKANLNSGNEIVNKSFIRELDNIDGTAGADGVKGTKDDEKVDSFEVLFNNDGKAFNLKDGQGVKISFSGKDETGDTDSSGNPTGDGIPDDLKEYRFVTDPAKIGWNVPDSDTDFNIKGEMSGGEIEYIVNGKKKSVSFDGDHNTTMDDLATALSNETDIQSATATDSDNDGVKDTITIKAEDGKSVSVMFNVSNATGLDNLAIDGQGTYYFNNTEDLRKGLQDGSRAISSKSDVTVNQEGKYQISNANGDSDLNILVEGISDNNTDENDLFTLTMRSVSGILTAGSSGIKTTQAITAATHASSIDIFDSLGTKHTVRLEFRKSGYIRDTSGTKVGTQWDLKVSVPEPGDIGGIPIPNVVEGSVIFGSDGSLSTYTPTSITYTANNGSAPNQTIQLNLGTPNKFDGLTSFDSPSNTSGISQDGFMGGDLDGVRIDQTGTLIGSFTNGRSFGLAQIAMAKFTNNVGLESDGGNLFVQTANSGEPVIGQPATGGRGFIQSSALEMSNVDLSRSLTQLIVIQRGFQANSKTITTSDQMLNTLLQLKQ